MERNGVWSDSETEGRGEEKQRRSAGEREERMKDVRESDRQSEKKRRETRNETRA